MTSDATITPVNALALLRNGDAVLVDVREPDEYRAAHIPWALSMPLGQLDALLGETGIPEGRTLIFQCLKGGRGGQACLVADRAGHGAGRDIRNLLGGIEGWTASGLPVVRAEGATGPAIPIMRQVQIVVGLLVLAATLAGLSGIGWGFYLAALFGFMLAFAGFTGWCGMAMLLARAPWNR
ncbi:rhodanese-like domain-containing protein [Sphingomonas quercus]|uniref:Rhodanese-like domain-containing protein n=1 Tax=Sphingomonas quercus TaxID=2842451 RepID=A0ABS6BLM9_9SPHN|nr:rhodanese-like domain-containing protein [Sphingomonas quercus]MBU3079084.1 rhodanese-like domain-containing protein [Sphingomonas quercus]